MGKAFQSKKVIFLPFSGVLLANFDSGYNSDIIDIQPFFSLYIVIFEMVLRRMGWLLDLEVREHLHSSLGAIVLKNVDHRIVDRDWRSS